MTFSTTPTLETERLLLRPPTLSDVPDVQRLFGQWEIIRYIGAVPWPYPDNGALTFYADKLLPKMKRGEMLAWVITDKRTGDLLGASDINIKVDRNMRGFWIGLPYQRQGFISEALLATNDYLFDELSVPAIHIQNAQENTASSRTQAKSGAELVGVDESKYGGEFKLQENWLLTPERWRDSPMKRAAQSPSYKLIA